MRAQLLPAAFLLLSLSSSFVRAAPLARRDAQPASLSAPQIESFHPYTYYAAAAYCPANETLNWACGENCEQSPSFTPVASGGDGNAVQFWYVGYDKVLQSAIVAHQGTDPTKFLSILTDLKFILTGLPEEAFPGVSDDVLVHSGFLEQHTTTAPDVLAALNTTLAKFNTDKVTFIGHSLGGALALLDAVYFRLLMPEIKITVRTYGMPRVGNPEFAAWVDEHIPDLIRVTNKKDPIPIVPGRGMGYSHPSHEVHIRKSDEEWVYCAGQDNTSSGCSIGDTPNIIFSNVLNHMGPYNDIWMGACWINGKRELEGIEAH